ncbi:MAG TPA: class I SAM-dependent methyltransferase [Candidatus Acidoferrum sp.]|jgi:SAM-dependent methyltransferase
MAESISEIQAAPALAHVTQHAESQVLRDVCLMCGGALKVVLTGLTDNRLGSPGSWQICQCTRCGFEQIAPIPDQAQLTKLYEKFYNFGGQTDTAYTRLREKFLLSVLYRWFTKIDGDVAFHHRRGHGRLLDIGCNEGRSLRLFARNGFRELEGLEVNETAAATARAAGFTVHTGLIDDFAPQKQYDVAILSNVLEHSLDPRKMLSDARRVLAPGGQVWISCPNSQSWLRKAFGRSWLNWHVPFHISHFAPQTLTRLLVDAGFATVEMKQITPALWFAQSLIVYLFSSKGQKTWQLRNPVLTVLFMALARFLLFPLLWWENRKGRGDCLLVVAQRT